MIKNYLKIAWRNLLRNRSQTIINITGLSVGLACGILILLWVQDELKIDAYHSNSKQLYQAYSREYFDNSVDASYETPGILAQELKKDYPEVQYAASMEETNDDNTFQAGSRIIKLSGMFAGDDLFKMFSYPLLKGSPATALNTLTSMAISEKMAIMFFGSADAAMGKTLRYNNMKDFTVTAVFKDLDKYNSRKFEYVINWQAFLKQYPGNQRWDNTGPLTYIMLRPDANAEVFGKKIVRFRGKYTTENAKYHSELYLQPFGQVYLHGHFTAGYLDRGRIEYVNLFSIVAVFILLIACVNFMNLATAQSVKRAREIGVRKVMGALRGTLIGQFIGESLLLTTLSVIAALVLMVMLLPLFNQLTQKQLEIPFNDIGFWWKLVVLTLATGLIAGSYPALFLSSFNPIKVLKGSMRFTTGAVWFRKGLVVFQFVLSGVMVIATIVVSRQVNYIQQFNLGYDRENLVYIPIEGNLSAGYNTFKSEALKIPGVTSVCNISSTPTVIGDATTSIQWDLKQPGNTVQFNFAGIGFDVVSAMKLHMKEGRDFSKARPADSGNYVINETAARKFGYKEPVGKTIDMWGTKGTIIGVVKDFNFASIHDPIVPLIMYLKRGNLTGDYIMVRIGKGKTAGAIAGLKSLCGQLNPAFPFTFRFSDDEYQKLYTSEQVAGNLSNVFAVLAIFISCLGLLGLAMFTAEQRTKEIGIRKVLGASIRSLFTLLSSDFLILVAISLVIASPLAWFATNKWLQSYAYSAPVQWWMFAAAGAIIVLIALATVSFQAIKAALANPVKSLRSE